MCDILNNTIGWSHCGDLGMCVPTSDSENRLFVFSWRVLVVAFGRLNVKQGSQGVRSLGFHRLDVWVWFSST